MLHKKVTPSPSDLKKLLKMFTKWIVSEKLNGRKRKDVGRIKLAAFQKTFEFGMTD